MDEYCPDIQHEKNLISDDSSKWRQYCFIVFPVGNEQRYLSRVVRKPAFCICENKDADQLRGNHEADQRLCFRYTDSTIPLLSKSEISSFYPSSVAVQPGLYRTRSKPPKTGFLRTRLIFKRKMINHITQTYLCNIQGFLKAVK